MHVINTYYIFSLVFKDWFKVALLYVGHAHQQKHKYAFHGG